MASIPSVSATDRSERTSKVREDPGRPAFVLALCLVFFLRTVVIAAGGPPGADYHLRWQLLLSDLGLAAVALTQLPGLASLWRRPSRHRCALAALVLAVSLVPSWLLHPSARGNAAVLRLLGVALLALAIGRLAGAGRSLVVGAFAGVTAVQVFVALAQRAAGGPLGIASLGEVPPFEIGGRYASSGLTVHPYVLAAWCVIAGAVLLAAVARSERNLVLGVAAAFPFVGVGLTMGRTGALAVFLVFVSFAVAAVRRPRLRIVVAGAVLAAALGVLLNFSGWVNRGSETTSGSGDLSSGRTALLHQAGELFRDSPIFGVGPGRYVETVTSRPEVERLSTERPSRPVHLTPYLLVVEGGLIVVPGLLMLAWAALTQARRGGAIGFAIAFSLVPFLLLDHLPWSYPEGLLLVGIWLGALDQLNRGEEPLPQA